MQNVGYGSGDYSLTPYAADPPQNKTPFRFINHKGVTVQLFGAVNNNQVAIINSHVSVVRAFNAHNHRCRRMLNDVRVEVDLMLFIPLSRAWKSSNHASLTIILLEYFKVKKIIKWNSTFYFYDYVI